MWNLLCEKQIGYLNFDELSTIKDLFLLKQHGMCDYRIEKNLHMFR